MSLLIHPKKEWKTYGQEIPDTQRNLLVVTEAMHPWAPPLKAQYIVLNSGTGVWALSPFTEKSLRMRVKRIDRWKYRYKEG